MKVIVKFKDVEIIVEDTSISAISEVKRDYDTIVVENLESENVEKSITLYKDGEPIKLYNDLTTIYTGWIQYNVPYDVVDGNKYIFKNKKIRIEPPEPRLEDNRLVADKVYIE